MINLEKINALLNRKNESFADVRDELVGLVEGHPYSGPFRMLLAKASKDAGHLDQRQGLCCLLQRIVNSRKALFELMFGEAFRREARPKYTKSLKRKMRCRRMSCWIWFGISDERTSDDESEQICSVNEKLSSRGNRDLP